MPKRISKAKKKRRKRPTDINQLAHLLVRESTEEEKPDALSEKIISDIMTELGRRGGKIGGKRSLETMTPEDRSARGLLAARVRWAKRKK
jgi:hypothetical protein